jgi:hypothetical protein
MCSEFSDALSKMSVPWLGGRNYPSATSDTGVIVCRPHANWTVSTHTHTHTLFQCHVIREGCLSRLPILIMTVTTDVCSMGRSN